MKVRLRYWDLGRSKAKGNVEIVGIDAEDINEQIYREFRKYLISYEISFNNGIVFAGCHKVGEYIVIGDMSG